MFASRLKIASIVFRLGEGRGNLQDEQRCELNQCGILYLQTTGKLTSLHHCPAWKNINVGKGTNLKIENVIFGIVAQSHLEF